MVALTFTAKRQKDQPVQARQLEVPYADALFTTEATTYNHDLAQVSVVMAASAYTRNENSVGLGYAADNLQALGFTTVDFGRDIVDDPNNVAFTLGYKQLADRNVFAVIVRGTPKSAEWAGDFMIGDDDAPGMANMLLIGQTIMTQLTAYMQEMKQNDLPNVFWVTGHSRGGSATEVVGKLLIDAGETNVYAYAFAPTNTYKLAAGVDFTSQYAQVHAIINPLDAAPQFPLEKWGFTHVGQQHYFPLTDFADMTAYYEKINQQAFPADQVEDQAKLDRGLQLYYALAPSVHDFYHAETPWWNGGTMTPYEWIQDMMLGTQGQEIPARTMNVMAYVKTHPIYAKLFQHLANDGNNSFEHTVTTYISFMAVLPADWVNE